MLGILHDMQRAIVVCTWSGGKDFTTLCLKSLPKFPTVIVLNDAPNASQEWVENLSSSYPVLLVNENRYELGAIEGVYKHTQIEEFWLIQHTIEITNPDIIPLGFYHKGISVSYASNLYENYLGKYIRKTLDKIKIPEAQTKWEALYYESEFHNAYTQADGNVIYIDPTFYSDNPNNYLEEIFNELRFVEVGQFLRKRRSITVESHNLDLYDIKKFIEYWQR